MNENANAERVKEENVKEEITISIPEVNTVLNEALRTRPLNESVAIIQAFVSIGILKEGFTLPIVFHKTKPNSATSETTERGEENV